MPDQLMTPAKLRELANRVLDHEYGLGSAVQECLAAADAWEADMKYKRHIEEECKTAEETCDYLRKRLDAAECPDDRLTIRAHLHDFQHQYHNGLGIQVVAIARNAANLYLPWNLAVAVGELVQKAIEGVDWLSDDHGCTWEKKHE